MRHLNRSLFSSTHVIPHPLTPYGVRPGGHRPPSNRQTSIDPPPPGIRWPSLAGGVQTRPSALGFHSGQTGLGSPGQCPFLTASLPLSPYATSHSPGMVGMGRKGCNPTQKYATLSIDINPGCPLQIA